MEKDLKGYAVQLYNQLTITYNIIDRYNYDIIIPVRVKVSYPKSMGYFTKVFVRIEDEEMLFRTQEENNANVIKVEFDLVHGKNKKHDKCLRRVVDDILRRLLNDNYFETFYNWLETHYDLEANTSNYRTSKLSEWDNLLYTPLADIIMRKEEDNG